MAWFSFLLFSWPDLALFTFQVTFAAGVQCCTMKGEQVLIERRGKAGTKKQVKRTIQIKGPASELSDTSIVTKGYSGDFRSFPPDDWDNCMTTGYSGAFRTFPPDDWDASVTKGFSGDFRSFPPDDWPW